MAKNCSCVKRPYAAPACLYVTAQPARNIATDKFSPENRNPGRKRGLRCVTATCACKSKYCTSLSQITYQAAILISRHQLAIDNLILYLVSEPGKALWVVLLLISTEISPLELMT